MPSAWRSRAAEDCCLAFSADRNGVQPGRLVVTLQIDVAPSEYQRALNEVVNGKFRCARLIVENLPPTRSVAGLSPEQCHAGKVSTERRLPCHLKRKNGSGCERTRFGSVKAVPKGRKQSTGSVRRAKSNPKKPEEIKTRGVAAGRSRRCFEPSSTRRDRPR
jgi:hypothetical protein